MGQDLFKKISATIRKERLYTDVDLMREQFKRCYGITPAEYRAGLLSDADDTDETM